jgi:hypothetical protein
MPQLKATPEFARLCQGFHQDCMVLAPCKEALVDDLLKHISPAEHHALKQFLDRLLGGRYTHSELRGLMNRSAPALLWSSKGAAAILITIHRRLSNTT